MLALAIIGVIILVVGLVIGSTLYKEKKALGLLCYVLAPVIAVLLVMSSCMTSVPAGHTGVVTTFGKVENYTLDSGIHFTLPWQEVIKMDNRIQKQTTTLSCFSSDIQEVTMTYTVNYQIKKSDAMTIYSTIGVDYYNTVITPSVAEAVKVATARYTAEDLVALRDELAGAIEEILSVKLLTYNIEVVNTSIEDMDFTDAFTNAVEEKQVAQQNKLRAETEAEQKVIEAQAAAQVQRVNADAEAYEVLAKAQAEAEANREVAESLTPELIEYIYANNWDGKLPTVVTGGDGESATIIDASDLVG